MDSKKRFLINVSFYSAVLLTVYVIYVFLFKSLLPILISLIIGVLVQKPARFLEAKLKIKRQIFAAIFGALVYIFVAAILGFGFFYLLKFGKDFLENMPDFSDEIGKIITDFKSGISGVFSEKFPEFAEEIESFLTTSTKTFFEKIGNSITKVLTNMAANTPAIMLNTAISLVACCYIAKDYEKLVKFFKNLFGNKVYENTVKIKSILTESVFKIFKGYFKLALITFGILFLTFWILKIKFFVLLAFLVALVDFLPVLGTGTVLVPWGLLDIIIGDYKRGAIILVVYLGISLLRNFLEPKIIAKQVGINPLFMLISIFLGLRLFGVLGVILVPVVMIVIYEFYSTQTDKNAG